MSEPKRSRRDVAHAAAQAKCDRVCGAIERLKAQLPEGVDVHDLHAALMASAGKDEARVMEALAEQAETRARLERGRVVVAEQALAVAEREAKP